MADEAIATPPTKQLTTTTQRDGSASTTVPSAVQAVINQYARDAEPASKMLADFQSGPKSKVLRYVYEDGSFGEEATPTGSVTNAKILEYVYPARPGELPATIGGYTFNELCAFLTQLDKYLTQQHLENPQYFPGFDKTQRWTSRIEDVRFGTNPNAKSSREELFASIDIASYLVNYIRDRNDKLRETAKPDEEITSQTTTQAAAVSTIGGITPIALFRDTDKELDEKEKEKRKKEKEEEEKQKQPQPGDTQNFLRQMAQGDAAFHKEIIRMEVMLANQLTEFYAKNFNDKTKTQFSQSLLPLIGPYLYYELQKLNPDQLAAVLRSPKDRLNIYFNVLLRMQQDPTFRARVSLSVDRASKQKQSKDEKVNEQKADERADKLQPKEIATAIATLEEKNGSQFLNESEIIAAAQLQSTPTATLADQIRTLLGKEGAGLADSDVRNILVRLQTLAITRANVHRLSADQFQEIFGPVFGKQNSVVFNRIEKYFTNAQLDWTRLFSSYIQSSRIRIATETGNVAALFMPPPELQPQEKTLNFWYKVVSDRGEKAAGKALYETNDSLKQQREELVAAGIDPSENPELANVMGALSIKHETAVALQRLATLKPAQQRAVLRTLGHSLIETVYLAPRIDAALQFFQVLYGPTPTPAHDSIEYYEIYIAPPPSIAGEIVDGEFVLPPEFFDPERIDALSQLEGFQGLAGTAGLAGFAQGNLPPGEKKKLMVAGRSVERWAGIASLALITGGASMPIVEQVDKLQSAIAVIPGGQILNGLIDKYGWDAIDKLGKLTIVTILAMIGGTLLQLLAWIALIIKAYQLGQALAHALSGFIKNFVSAIKQFVGGTVVPTISRIAAGIGHALGTLSSGALGALASTLSAPFLGGTAIASITTVVMTFSVTGMFNLDGAFLTNAAGTNAAVAGNAAPNVGCYQFVTDQTELTSVSKQYSVPTKPFTAAEEQMVAITGGVQFSYGKLFNLLCGPSHDRAVKLVRASGSTWGGWTVSADMIILYDNGLYVSGVPSQEDLDYTLWHEAGHVMDQRNSNLMPGFAAAYSGGRFETYPSYAVDPATGQIVKDANGNPVCSATVPLSEAFAESISLYLMSSHFPNHSYYCAGGAFNFPVRRPSEYNWVSSNIYN